MEENKKIEGKKISEPIKEKKHIDIEEINKRIPQGFLKELEIITQIIGGDFNMSVKLGRPGGGSFFSPVEKSVTLDPLHIIERPKMAKFLSGHEGGHRAITKGPHELGLKNENIQELYKEIGFAYLQNVIEDGADNNWVQNRYEGFKELEEEFYDEQFAKQNSMMVTPEVEMYIKILGRNPKFVQFGSELLRQWWENKFSNILDPQVKETLNKIIEDARLSWNTISDTSRRDETEILKTARTRFMINTEKVWPEMKKLVDEELSKEKIREMLKEMLKDVQIKFDDKEQNGDSFPIPLNLLPEDLQKELLDKIKQAMKEREEFEKTEIQKREEKIKDSQEKQKNLEDELEKLKEKLKSADREEKEKLESELQQKEANKELEKLHEEQLKEELEKFKKELQEMKEKYGTTPLPDNISQELEKKLKELFDQQSQEKKNEQEKKAKETLEGLEDELNKGLEGKLNEDNPESHKTMRAKRENEQRDAARKTQEKQELEKVKQELEKKLLDEMSEYEKARAKNRDLIEYFVMRLKRILRPEELGKEEMGLPTGQTLDIQRAMQSTQDFNQKTKLWTRRDAPGELDYRFGILADVSASMKDDEKINETYDGLVVTAEGLDIVGTKLSIMAYHNRQFPCKDFNERFTGTVREKLSSIKEHVKDNDASTDTYTATKLALEDLLKNLGQTGNFLLTFSDGDPNPNIRNQLIELLTKSKNERKSKKIKVGLIWLGTSEDKEQLNIAVQEKVEKYGYDFGLVLPAVRPSKEEAQKGAKNFAQELADLMENIIKNPDKY